LIDRAGSAEAKRDRTLRLGRVYEVATGDRKRALSTFEKARKAWPHDAEVLRALAEFYQRGGESTALSVLLERSTAEARRALAHGRFDATFFGMLMTVAELRGGEDAAMVAGATLAAIEGRLSPLRGAGAAAGSVDLDDLLAPELLNSAFRAFFKKVAGVLDAAIPTDLRALAAAPLPAEDAEFVDQVRQVAASLGIQRVEVLVSPALGPVWLPASATPPRIVIGRPLLEAGDDPARYFALFQCLKTIQSQTAPLSRIAPIDLMPTVAALLSAVAPSYQPAGVDSAKYAAAKKKNDANLLPRIDNDVPMLALEIGGTIGNRASQLGTAINQWANRAALLAVGDPSIALRAIGRGHGSGKNLPDEGVERLKWIVRNPEARDLAVFSVSDAYTEARQRVGLST
jgi:hypothetical protein